MRHNKKKGLKLGTDASHTKAMKKSLAKALFENDRIKTTETRAMLSPSSPGPRRATCTPVVSPSPSSVTRTSSPRSSTRLLRACGPTATAVIPAS
mgnify:CR=1 FL=1